MKRAGFTMIELIFVIVILGILAAVAVPKLAATRSDAKIAKLSSGVSTLVGELGSSFTAQGTWAVNLDTISNVADCNASAAPMADGTVITCYDDSSAPCITMTIHKVADGNMTVAAGTGTTEVCKGVKAATASMLKYHAFGGSNISY